MSFAFAHMSGGARSVMLTIKMRQYWIAIIAMRFPKQKYIIRCKLQTALAACINEVMPFSMQRNRKLTHLLHLAHWREQRCETNIATGRLHGNTALQSKKHTSSSLHWGTNCSFWKNHGSAIFTLLFVSTTCSHQKALRSSDGLSDYCYAKLLRNWFFNFA